MVSNTHVQQLTVSFENLTGDFKIQRRDGNDSVKNQNRFSRQNNNFARAPYFFVHFFAVYARLKCKIA